MDEVPLNRPALKLQFDVDNPFGLMLKSPQVFVKIKSNKKSSRIFTKQLFLWDSTKFAFRFPICMHRVLWSGIIWKKTPP